MKTLLRTALGLSLLSAAILFTSCDKVDDVPPPPPPPPAEARMWKDVGVKLGELNTTTTATINEIKKKK